MKLPWSALMTGIALFFTNEAYARFPLGGNWPPATSTVQPVIQDTSCPEGTKKLVIPDMSTTSFNLNLPRKYTTICMPDPDGIPACGLIYEGEGFGGMVRAISMGEIAHDLSKEMIERRTWHGKLRGWSGKDRSWKHHIASVKIAPGCTMTLFDQADLAGDSRIFHAQGPVEEVRSVSLSASSMTCECGDNVDPSFRF